MVIIEMCVKHLPGGSEPDLFHRWSGYFVFHTGYKCPLGCGIYITAAAKANDFLRESLNGIASVFFGLWPTVMAVS